MSLEPRSLFFVPGDRPDMVAKIPRWHPDVAVVDLEDAVAAGEKDRARAAAVAAIAALDPGPTLVLIRVNAAGSPWHDADVAAAGSVARGVVLPKYSSAAQVVALRAVLGPEAAVVVGLETVLGVADSRPLLAAPGVDAAYFGAEDYVADIGGRRSPGGAEVLAARSLVMLAARLAGVGAVDQAVVAIHDDDRFLTDAAAGRDLGYTGKICIHPHQVELAAQVFTPTGTEIERARTVLAAAAGGVGVLDGEMIDHVHVRLAEAVLDRARRTDGPA
jgi:citrate lyase subunit beta/citryl-CoA lyase